MSLEEKRYMVLDAIVGDVLYQQIYGALLCGFSHSEIGESIDHAVKKAVRVFEADKLQEEVTHPK